MTQKRILLSPESEGNGDQSDEVENPVEERVTIPKAEFEALTEAARIVVHPTPGVPPLEASGNELALREELAGRDRLLAEREESYRAALKDRELAVALSGRPLIAGAASQLLKLWREDLEVIDDGGRQRVVSRDGRPVAQAVASWLASPEFAHFAPPPSRGGTATPGVTRPGQPGPSAPARNLGEEVLNRWRDAADRPAPMAGPFGLRRR